MVWFQSAGSVPGQYQKVAASQTTKALGTTGATGDYLEAFTIVAATVAPGAVTVFDGTTAVFTMPAGTATVLPYTNRVEVRAYSQTGSWNITTGTNVSVIAVGQFS